MLHVKEKHCYDFESQTELECDENNAKFEEFLCFYCEISIQSIEDLEMPRSECQPIPLTVFPCKKCGALNGNVYYFRLSSLFAMNP